MSIVSCKICFLNLENLRQNQKQHPLKIHPNPFTRVRVVSEISINRICGPVCVGFQCDYIIHLIIHAVYFTIFLFSFENKLKVSTQLQYINLGHAPQSVLAMDVLRA